MIIKINEKRGVCPVFVWRGHVLGKHCNMSMNRIDASSRQSGVRSGSESIHRFLLPIYRRGPEPGQSIVRDNARRKEHKLNAQII